MRGHAAARCARSRNAPAHPTRPSLARARRRLSRSGPHIPAGNSKTPAQRRPTRRENRRSRPGTRVVRRDLDWADRASVRAARGDRSGVVGALWGRGARNRRSGVADRALQVRVGFAEVRAAHYRTLGIQVRHGRGSCSELQPTDPRPPARGFSSDCSGPPDCTGGGSTTSGPRPTTAQRSTSPLFGRPPMFREIDLPTEVLGDRDHPTGLLPSGLRSLRLISGGSPPSPTSSSCTGMIRGGGATVWVFQRRPNR